jgi:hypothetical protein
VVVVYFVLNATLAVNSEGVVAEVAAIVNCDMVVVMASSGLETGGLGRWWSAGDHPRSPCHRSGGASGRLEGGGSAAAAVVHGVGSCNVAI